MNSNTPCYTQQLRLIRFTQTSDQNAQFTFILPSNLVRGFVDELISPFFEFANQNWRLRMIRSELHIGAFVELILPNKSIMESNTGNLIVMVDVSLNIVNLNHFSENQTFSKQQVLFNRDNTMFGSGCLIEVSSLGKRSFIREDSHLLVELELGNAMISCNLHLIPSCEDSFESNFYFANLFWKLTLVIDFEDQIDLNLYIPSSKSGLVYLISFGLLITPNVEIRERLDLLIRDGEAEIELSRNTSERIATVLMNSLNTSSITMCLQNIRFQKFCFLTLHRELMIETTFSMVVEDTEGFLWNVEFFQVSNRLYTRLTPKRTQQAIVKSNSIRILGWNLCFRRHRHGVTHFSLHQKNFISQLEFQTTSVISTDLLSRNINQKCMKDEDWDEFKDSTFPGVAYLQVSRSFFDYFN